MKETILLLPILLSLNFAQPVFAVTINPATPSAVTPSPSVDPSSVTEALKLRLKESLTGEETVETDTATSSFVGNITDIIQKTIIVHTKDGKRNVVTSDDTTILRSPGNKVIKFDNIALDDNIIAIGNLKNQVLDGKRLIVSANPLTTTTKKTGYGQIVSLGKSTLTLSYYDEEIKLLLDTTTVIKSKNSSNLKINDLPENARIIYTAEQDGDEIRATVIMLIQ